MVERIALDSVPHSLLISSMRRRGFLTRAEVSRITGVGSPNTAQALMKRLTETNVFRVYDSTDGETAITFTDEFAWMKEGG